MPDRKMLKREPKIFFGWWVLGVTMLVAFMSSVVSQFFMGVMLPFIEEDTGWSRTSITGAITVGSMAAGFIAPFFGRMADQYGPRVLTSLGLVATVISIFLIAGVTNLGMFYIAYLLGRGISQNTLTGVVPRTTAVNWFRRMRGRALGLTQMSLPLGGAGLALAAQALMSLGFSWREIFFLYGSLMCVFLLPLTIGVLRRRPEDMGLLPDGEKSPIGTTEGGVQSTHRQSSPESYSWTLKEALRTRTFWYLVFAMAIGVMANGGIGFHQFAYFRDQGISQAMAAIALSSYALSGAVANGLWGLLVEKISERLIAVVTMAAASLLCLFLMRVDSFPEAMIFAILFGLAARGESSIIMMMQANYYGRKSFGAISGFSTPFQQIGLGLGPTLAAIPYDLLGTYNYGFVAFALLYVLSGFLILLAKRPNPPANATH